jgi:RNA polymerase sigma factor (sigma-70 family)
MSAAITYKIMQSTDNELLLQYQTNSHDAAFRELIDRHGRMVMGICRSLTRKTQDAEDAFQATFMVLAIRSTKMTHINSVAGFLYRVAVRTCQRLIKQNARRKEHPMDTDPIAPSENAIRAIEIAHATQVLHEELERLPENYRDVIALCHLQGLSRNEAAERLDCTEASVKAALARGKRRLRMQMIRRGLSLTFALAAITHTIATDVAVANAALVQRTLDICQGIGTAAAGSATASTVVNQLVQNGVREMSLLTALKIPATLMATAALFAVPILVWAQQGPNGNSAPPSSQLVLEQTLRDKNANGQGAVKPTSVKQNAFTQTSQQLKGEQAGGSAGVNFTELTRTKKQNSKSNQPKNHWQIASEKFEWSYEEMTQNPFQKIAARKLDLTRSYWEAKRAAATLRRNGTQPKNGGGGYEDKAQHSEFEAEILHAELKLLEAELEYHQTMAQHKQPASPTLPKSTDNITAGMSLEVEITGGPRESSRRVIVLQDETIRLPLIGTISVAGLNIEQVEEKIAEEYNRFIPRAGAFVSFTHSNESLVP